jgi:hypothetical protein
VHFPLIVVFPKAQLAYPLAMALLPIATAVDALA